MNTKEDAITKAVHAAMVELTHEGLVLASVVVVKNGVTPENWNPKDYLDADLRCCGHEVRALVPRDCIDLNRLKESVS